MVTRDAFADVLAERNRQKLSEGWTIQHDDQHKDGSLAAAAAAYAHFGSLDQAERTFALTGGSRGLVNVTRFLWPRSWSWEYWKPKNKRRDLVRAGALILAEIERLDRADATTTLRARRGAHAMTARDRNALQSLIDRADALYQRCQWPTKAQEHLDEAIRRLMRAMAELEGRNE